MARAKIVTERVRLTLTRREAEVLRTVTQFVGGKPSGARGCIDAIDIALGACNIAPASDHCAGSIMFSPKANG